MNKRIKEFEKQCWSHRVDGVLVDGHLHFDTKKFAQVIAAECISVVTNFSPSYPLRYKNNLLIEVNHRDQIEEFFRGDLVEGIKEHFGVKL